MTKVTVWAALLALVMAAGCDSGKPAVPANPPADDFRQAPEDSGQAAAPATGSQRSATQQESPGPALGDPGRAAATGETSPREDSAGAETTEVAPDEEAAGSEAASGESGGQTLRGLRSAFSRALGKTLTRDSGAQGDDAVDVSPPEGDPFPEGEPDDPQIEEPETPQIEE